MRQSIRIKPHHLVDILCDIGAGQTNWQPHPCGHLVHVVGAAVMADPEATIEMDFGADDICRPCLHNINGRCDDTIDTSFRPKASKSKRENNLLLDRRWSERLGLAEGSRLTVREFCRLLRERAWDDISDIYREEPAGRSMKRLEKMRHGVERLLAE